MVELADWFEEKVVNVDERKSLLSPKNSMVKRPIKDLTKRIIVVTLVLTPTMYLLPENQDSDQANTDPMDQIHDAIILFLNKLKPEDYICFNIGNVNDIIQNDNQKMMRHYEEVLKEFEWIKEKIQDEETWSFIEAIKNQMIRVDPDGGQSWFVRNFIKAMHSLNVVKDGIYLGFFLFIFDKIAFNNGGSCYGMDGNFVPLFSELSEKSNFYD